MWSRTMAVFVVATGSLLALSPTASASSPGVKAWGYNGDGELGDGNLATSSQAAMTVVHLSGVTAVAAGAFDSLALLSNGTVKAWGFNKYGQLGGGVVGKHSDVPVTVSGLNGVVTAISAGGFDNLALLNNGTVMAWGENAYGDLGDGMTANSDEPMAVCAVGATAPCSVGRGNVLTGVTAISAGGFYNLALMGNGTVAAWGENVDGDLGDGTVTTSRDVPAIVMNLSGVTALAAGGNQALALLGNGTVRAWGSNQYGQLGSGHVSKYSDVPVTVRNLRAVTSVAAGDNHNLALLSNGTVKAWGLDNWGQLGNGDSSKSSALPVTVCALGALAPCSIGRGNALTGVRQIAAGGFHSLALMSNGTVDAWGSNEWNVLGDNTITGKLSVVPVAVDGLTGVTAISAGGYHSLAKVS